MRVSVFCVSCNSYSIRQKSLQETHNTKDTQKETKEELSDRRHNHGWECIEWFTSEKGMMFKRLESSLTRKKPLDIREGMVGFQINSLSRLITFWKTSLRAFTLSEIEKKSLGGTGREGNRSILLSEDGGREEDASGDSGDEAGGWLSEACNGNDMHTNNWSIRRRRNKTGMTTKSILVSVFASSYLLPSTCTFFLLLSFVSLFFLLLANVLALRLWNNLVEGNDFQTKNHHL